MNGPEDEALNQILGDMDGMESGRMFGAKPGDASSGVSITISVVPNGEGQESESEYPEGHDIGMCKGGCVDHMSKGGIVETKPASISSPTESEDKTLPPFLRKKKKSLPSF